MIQIILGFIEDFRGILFAVVGVINTVSVIQTWARLRSLAPTIGVVIVGAVVLWGLASLDFITDEVEEDVGGNNQPNQGGGGGDAPACRGRPTCPSTRVALDPSEVVIVVDLAS